MRRLTTTALSLVAATTVVVGLAGTASAAPGDPVDKNRQALQAQIDRRQAQTAKLQDQVDGSKYLTADHKAALTTEISATDAGLAGIEGQIAGAGNPALKTLREQMVGDYRVFVVLTPKVHETIAGDAEQDALADFATAEPKLAAAITKAQAGGQDVTSAQASLDDLGAKVGDATSTIGGLDATIAGFEPSGYPADKDAIKATRDQLATARADLVAARDDARQIKADLA